jgi:hypothetical protein
MEFAMARPTEPETYIELAEHCRWEADRTLDHEVAQSLRVLADRFKQMSARYERRDGEG